MDDSSLFIRAVRLDKEKISNPKEYPFRIPSLKKFKRLEFTAPVSFLIGENGMGKSTLIESLAVKAGFNAEGGTRNFHFSTKATHSKFHEALILERGTRKPTDGYFFRAESFYTFASELEAIDSTPSMDSRNPLGAYGCKSLHAQSHGEAFLSLVTNRLRGNGLYIFDEPEAALSPARQLTVLAAMHELAKKASQFIIATHSPILMAFPGAQIYELSSKGIKKIHYEDTEHYVITKSFLNKTELMLGKLLE